MNTKSVSRFVWIATTTLTLAVAASACKLSRKSIEALTDDSSTTASASPSPSASSSASASSSSSSAAAAAPTVVSVTPNGGPLAGGTLVAVAGTGYVTGASVSLGGANCTGVTVVNANLISCTTTAHSAGAVTAVVTNSDAQTGSLASAFTYRAAPTVTSVAPSTGPSSGGTSITITGTGFVASATVSVGGVNCGSVNVASATSITCTTGVSTMGTKSVVVTNVDAQYGALAGGFYNSVAQVALHSGGLDLRGNADGTGTAARFNGPAAIDTDGTDLFVAEPDNGLIRKVTISTNAVTTIAGQPGVQGSANGTGTAATFNQPWGIVKAGANLYVADYGNHVIRKIVIATGAVTTFAGTVGSAGSVTGTGASARFNSPRAIATDGTNLYVADGYSNQLIRKIVIASGVVTNLAGQLGVSGNTDGTGTGATFNTPVGIVYDATANALFVTDTDGSTIRKVTLAGVVTTLAGTGNTIGTTDATGASARFTSPWGLCSDGTNLYIGDNGNNSVRKVVIATGAVTTLAGLSDYNNNTRGYVDATGTSARFAGPRSCAVTGGNIYMPEFEGHRIRKIVAATGVVTTFAGLNSKLKGSADGTGSAAAFSKGIQGAVDPSGANLYVSDFDNHTIRKVVLSTGVVTTLAGLAGNAGSTDATAAAARFNYPYGIAIDAGGNYAYVADYYGHTIRKVALSSGTVTTVAGSAGASGSTDATGSSARFNYPTTLAIDSNFLYINDSNNYKIRKMNLATTAVTTLAGSGSYGHADGTGTGASMRNIQGLAVVGNDLYFSQSDYSTDSCIRKVDLTTTDVTTVAGSSAAVGSTDATGTAARFKEPRGMSSDGTYLYISDQNNHSIRRMKLSDQVVTTIVGSASNQSDIDGVAASARTRSPDGLVFVAGYGLFILNEYGIRQAY